MRLTTPRPVVWGKGLPGESRQLPEMPVEDPFVVSCCAFSMQPAESRWSIFDHFCCCVRSTTSAARTAEEEAIRQQRANLLFSHGHAVGDDEILFHLLHVMHCLQCRPDDGRQFVILPPLAVHSLVQGDAAPLREWILDLPGENLSAYQVVTICWVDQHWVPIWIAMPDSRCHLLSDFVQDRQQFDTILRAICAELGMFDFVTHSVPHGLPTDGLCGISAVSFIAHIVLGTPMPQDIDQLHARSWAMKQVFWTAMQSRRPTLPSLWGWGVSSDAMPAGESRLLPRMPEVGPFVASYMPECEFRVVLEDMQIADEHDNALLGNIMFGLGLRVMQFHIALLQAVVGPDLDCRVVVGLHELLQYLTQIDDNRTVMIALLDNQHWSPVICMSLPSCRVIFSERIPGLETGPMGFSFIEVPCLGCDWCGASTWQFLTSCIGLCNHNPTSITHVAMQVKFVRWMGFAPMDTYFGFGPNGSLIKQLAHELAKHGVPENVVADRAALAITQLGSEPVQAALSHSNPWKQLKTLGNNSKFHFVLPSELAAEIAKNRGKPVQPKGKGKGSSKSARPPIDLDPNKLQVLEGTFQVQGKPLPQLTTQQIGPVSSGFILVSPHKADPYLRAGSQVSSEPLALVVLTRAGQDLQTTLPHMPVTVPCRCTLNSEPVLAEAVLVQVGAGLVEKASHNALVSVDTPDVVTIKVMVYKDELSFDWNEFCQAPIRCLVSLLPMLKRCLTPDCHCAAWHNHEGLTIRDPILDVWRRQFLRLGFKPCPADKAEIFSVCIRTPQCILDSMLGASGSAGAYCEPRTADGKEVLAEYTVIWTPKLSLQEMLHLKQTNPAVTGLARIGDRRGVRVHATQAKTIHQIVRPDAVYLPGGPRVQYTVGPLPFGADRVAVGKILSQAGWECRPLQPTAPCPGRGAMWLVQSIEEPAQTIISTTAGDIMIAKQKQPTVSPTPKPTNVGSAATLALCGTTAAKQPESDPWIAQDPWKTYQPTSGTVPTTGPVEGLQQIEERIQSSILAKMQPPMERDDVPDRVNALEGQVKHLLTKQQSLEAQFQEHSGHHAQQMNALQGQLTTQAQQLHGQLENQNQTMQSLFEQQMQQIRGLLCMPFRRAFQVLLFGLLGAWGLFVSILVVITRGLAFCQHASVRCRLQWPYLFCIALVCRVGEATNPGPNPNFVLGSFNPSGLPGKAPYIVSQLTQGYFGNSFVFTVHCCISFQFAFCLKPLQVLHRRASSASSIQPCFSCCVAGSCNTFDPPHTRFACGLTFRVV